MIPDAPACPSGTAGAPGGKCVSVQTFVPVRAASAPSAGLLSGGISGLVDEALLAARAWIASEVFLDERVEAVCERIRTSDGLEADLAEVLELCAELAGAECGVLLLRTEGCLRVAAAHGLDGRQRAAFAGFSMLASPVLPSGHEPVAGSLDPLNGSDDFLRHALRTAGLRSFVSVPLAIDGRLGEGVICLLSRGDATARQDSMRRIARAGARIAESIDRRRRAADHASREASLRAIVDSVSDGILTVDDSGRIRSANPSASRIFGYLSDELVGMPIGTLAPRNAPAQATGSLAGCVPGRGFRTYGHPFEVSARTKDGAEVPLEVTFSEIEPGKLVACVLRDISERKQSDARLRQSDRMASLGALAAGLGHDMNNVLFPVRAHLNALAMDAVARRATAAGEHVDQIQQGVRYLQQLADGLHYLVNDAGNADGGCDGAILSNWWRGTGALLRRSLPPLCNVSVEIPDALPRVRITEHALTQAVLNLFVNAGDAMLTVPDHGAGHVCVTAHASPDGRSIDLAISDDGPGMDEATRRRAFDMFFTTKVRGLGSGLGLAMVARAVEQAGGDARIESAPGRGTTVTLRLPVAADPSVDGAVTAISGLHGRAASFIESALGARGFRTVPEAALESADAWFVDPRAGEVAAVRSWRLRRTGRTVVLLGQPHRLASAKWSAVADCTIESLSDFDTLLVGVDRACSIIQRRRNDDRDHDDGGAGAAGADARAQEGGQRRHRRRRGGGARAGGG